MGWQIPSQADSEISRWASIAAGADTTITNRFGGTALIPAADRGHVEIVQLLIEHGANVNLADSDGATPLSHAKKRGFREMVDMLAKAGGK
ncbi:hypothetical protein AV540_01620 [Brevibacillus parabrevis]|nr:hypothetical protein AV540_01620 [Brevibacillus parabrevis]